MKNEQKQDKQSRGRRSLKVQDLETKGVEVKGGVNTHESGAYDTRDCAGNQNETKERTRA